MLFHLRSVVRLLYFVRWLRLRSLGDLENARSTTPITRHTNPRVISIVIFSPSTSPSAATTVGPFYKLLCIASIDIASQNLPNFSNVRGLQAQYLALVNQLLINIDRGIFCQLGERRASPCPPQVR